MDRIEFFLRIAVIGWCILVIWWIVSGIFLYHPDIKREVKRGFLKLIGKKIVYEKHNVGGNNRSKSQQALIKKNQNLLLENRVPINKIRFVFQPNFEYDVDKDVINPPYQIMIGTHPDTGLCLKDVPVIEVGKPENIMAISVGSYKTDDNYAYIKETLKRCKIGIAIFICDEVLADGTPYRFSVADDTVRFAVLDDAVEHFNDLK